MSAGTSSPAAAPAPVGYVKPPVNQYGGMVYRCRDHMLQVMARDRRALEMQIARSPEQWT